MRPTSCGHCNHAYVLSTSLILTCEPWAQVDASPEAWPGSGQAPAHSFALLRLIRINAVVDSLTALKADISEDNATNQANDRREPHNENRDTFLLHLSSHSIMELMHERLSLNN